MPILQIVADVGNHSTKIAIRPYRDTTFDDRRFAPTILAWPATFWSQREPQYFTCQHISELTQFNEWPNARWHIASVNSRRADELIHAVKSSRSHDTLQTLTYRDVPIAIDVDYPNRVGIDRLLAAWQASSLTAKHKPTIAVDSGTAVTVDLVSNDRVFLGGTIFPGIKLCFESLQRGTAQLPQLTQPEWPRDPCGRNTEQAIASGVLRMQLGALRHIVDEMQQRVGGQASVVMTGGGLMPIHQQLPDAWRYEPHLILDAMTQIADVESQESAVETL